MATSRFIPFALAVLLATAVMAPSAGWAGSGPDKNTVLLNPMVMAVSLGRQQLSDGITVYQMGDDNLVPIGQLAELFSIGVMVNPVGHAASGFLIDTEKTFRVDMTTMTATFPGRSERFDHNQVRELDGDIYVSTRLLQKWWPVDLAVDTNMLELKVTPRENLPVQTRLEREQAAERLANNGARSSRGTDNLPYVAPHYHLATLPITDLTLGGAVAKSGGSTVFDVSLSSVIAGDLMGMEANGFLFATNHGPGQARITLGRYDLGGKLLGPLQARSVVLGDVSLPTIKNLVSSSGDGNGYLISNRSLTEGISFGTKTLRGELPPGWDVSLYFNKALTGFQQSQPNGLYEFADLPLSFGKNEFVLLFNGPLGQRRVERQTVQFDQSLIKAGQLDYTLAGRMTNGGKIRNMILADYGISKTITVGVGLLAMEPLLDNKMHYYLTNDLRVIVLGGLWSVEQGFDLQGGSETSLNMRTSLLGVSVDGTHAWTRHLVSDTSSGTGSSISDTLRLNGNIEPTASLILPIALSLSHTKDEAGQQTYQIDQRISVNLKNSSLSNTLTWFNQNNASQLSGILQVSHRIAGFGLSNQTTYSIFPNMHLEATALSVDRSVNDYSRLSLGFLYTYDQKSATMTAALSRRIGKFGITLSAQSDFKSQQSIGFQIFTAFGPNPETKRLFQSPQALTGNPLINAHVFVDSNQNGRYDPGGEPVPGAGFTASDGHVQGQTDAKGQLLIDRLQSHAYVNLAIDPGSLEDAQWQPGSPGIKIMTRPGVVEHYDFPVVITGEVDGLITIKDGQRERPIGNATVELVNSVGKLVAKVRSSSDGYYVLDKVRPGHYKVRISPNQLKELGLKSDKIADIDMNSKGDFVYSVDFVIEKLDQDRTEPVAAPG